MAGETKSKNLNSWCFPAETARFLADLKSNNNREWFTANKSAYETAVKQPAEIFCSAITGALEKLTGAEHGSKIFRVHRDVRFAKDKTPYNSHLHISFFPAGAGAGSPHWMFGLEPGQLTFGVGIFAFDKTALDRFRKRIVSADGAKLESLCQRLLKTGARMPEPELRRVPSGFDADHKYASYLRRKGLSAWIDLPNVGVASKPGFVKIAAAEFTRLKPLVDWLTAS